MTLSEITTKFFVKKIKLCRSDCETVHYLMKIKSSKDHPFLNKILCSSLFVTAEPETA